MSELTDKLNEANAKLLKKAVIGAKKAGKYLKDQAGKSVDTARNAVVAGAVAPVGAGIAQRYTQPKKHKDQKYTSTDVAALATAMKSRGASESLVDRLHNYSKLLESKTTEKKSTGKTIAKATGAGTALGAVGGAAGLGKLATHLTGGVAGTVAPGFKGSLIRGTRTAAKVLGGLRGAMGGAALGAGAGVAKAIHDKTKTKEKNESLIEALNRLKSLVEEEGLPKKKRELTPEQKARRQERRKLRRQLEKQGLYQKKPRSGPVTTTSGGQKFSNDAIENAKKAQLNKSAKPAGETGKIKINLDKPKTAPAQNAAQAAKPVEDTAKKLSDAADKIKNTTKASTKKVDAAKKVFNKSAAFRKIASKAGRVGALKGAAVTAGAAGALYGAKKLLDKRNKGN